MCEKREKCLCVRANVWRRANENSLTFFFTRFDRDVVYRPYLPYNEWKHFIHLSGNSKNVNCAVFFRSQHTHTKSLLLRFLFASSQCSQIRDNKQQLSQFKKNSKQNMVNWLYFVRCCVHCWCIFRRSFSVVRFYLYSSIFQFSVTQLIRLGKHKVATFNWLLLQRARAYCVFAVTKTTATPSTPPTSTRYCID